MSEIYLGFCPTCERNGVSKLNFAPGYFLYHQETCTTCGTNLLKTGLSGDEHADIFVASNKNFDTVKAMIELKKTDSVEYSIKYAQFKEIAENIRKEQKKEREKERLTPKCPKCGSTAITAGQRGYSLMWGFLGSSNTVNRCSNCGHKWKPGK